MRVSLFGWKVFVEGLNLILFVFMAIVLVDLGGESYFDVATHFSTILAVTVTDAEEVH